MQNASHVYNNTMAIGYEAVINNKGGIASRILPLFFCCTGFQSQQLLLYYIIL